ncbi:uncharacterized protein LOC114395765 [Glycine soja]|uniref:DUF674 domain-containing protein n=1 Tax=Glycine soja TaxID=3848 RepID=A0A445FV05_GLYSO|nr:uncharacterized protein LOC114395765 [Glycine soja]RZB52750.1 hypothetical protein D0Y65_049000 [Glycine soja]
MATDEQVHKVSLKVLVDKEKNKVIFAEAGKDFVDALLSILTLPLGTIARLVAKESNIPPVKFGSLSSLYESVSHLEDKYLRTQTCKEMLLQPRNSMESYCQHVKLNIDDTEPTKYFLCANLNCSIVSGRQLSIFRYQRCRCGNQMNREVFPIEVIPGNGFVNEIATFIICDDLSVLPNVVGTSVSLLRKLGIKDMATIDERNVDISKREVVDILKLSLLSKTPLTDFILEKKDDNFNPINQPQIGIGEKSSDEGRKMDVKVLVRKSDSKILFVEAEADFADLLFSLLTLPLGGVLHMLNGCSSLDCIDKLYNSTFELNTDRYFRSQELKDKLANPQCAPQFNLHDQILPIGAVCLPLYYYVTVESCVCLTTSPNSWQFAIVDPKSCIGGSSSNGGFAKAQSMFLVTDDLVMTPMSSISCISFLNRSKVSPLDLEERVVKIGVKEALAILKASLTSTSALTNGLKQFIKKASIKREI